MKDQEAEAVRGTLHQAGGQQAAVVVGLLQTAAVVAVIVFREVEEALVAEVVAGLGKPSLNINTLKLG